jgi:hypothetical protein
MREANRIRASLGAVLTVGAIATLLSACGSGTTETEPTPAPKAMEAVKNENRPVAPSVADRDPERAREEAHEVDRTGPVQSGKERGEAEAESLPRKQASVAGCPTQISRQQCGEIAAAAADEEQGGSRSAPANECPPRLSQGACEELGEADHQPPMSRPVSPGECPPTLSRAQCSELEAAYKGSAR